eukprot:CAMPEP_0114288254 /NCGR_PEP_ID=MMETSP0059-20121206/6710_1 /TAXON_ID=36894 /ORGANISM="Pyramimonas parkeae, Strain CCMP726" /LENGTH=315 /DNA_ID=CAMNT_0001409383 /DNA_START=277 /DNA_END=1224 /DNA_ORIENTATION=-
MAAKPELTDHQDLHIPHRELQQVHTYGTPNWPPRPSWPPAPTPPTEFHWPPEPAWPPAPKTSSFTNNPPPDNKNLDSDSRPGAPTAYEYSLETAPPTHHDLQGSIGGMINDVLLLTRPPTHFPTTSPPTTAHPTGIHPTPGPTTLSPSPGPTSTPTAFPTGPPTLSPTAAPSVHPTQSPTRAPSLEPTKSPSMSPTTKSPTATRTKSPTHSPRTRSPTVSKGEDQGDEAPSARPWIGAEMIQSKTFGYAVGASVLATILAGLALLVKRRTQTTTDPLYDAEKIGLLERDSQGIKGRGKGKSSSVRLFSHTKYMSL